MPKNQTPPPISSPSLPTLSQNKTPRITPPESPIPLAALPETFPGGIPDDNSPQVERVAQGLPPV